MKTASKKTLTPFPFQGFETPESNFFSMPREWFKIRAKYVKYPSMIFVVEYILAHTWGWTHRDDEGNIVHDQKRHLTRDDFVHGRKKKDGSRYDNGTGLSENSVVNGLERAEKEGFIEVEIDDSDKGRIKKFYSLKMKASDEKQEEEENTSEEENHETKPENESKAPVDNAENGSGEEEQATVETRGSTVDPPTIDPLGSNGYPSYIRVNNSSKNFSSSIIDIEKIENVDKSGEEELPDSKASQEQPEIINYASLSPEKKLQAISVKFTDKSAKSANPFEALKENLEKLKSEEEAKKRNRGSYSKHTPKQPTPHLKRSKSRGADNLLVPKKHGLQTANKTLLLEVPLEVQEAEKLMESIKVLAEDIGEKLSDSKSRKKNITHMTNIYRQATEKGYSFQTFFDIAVFAMKDTRERQNVRNKGAYFYKSLEQRLGLERAERDGGGS